MAYLVIEQYCDTAGIPSMFSKSVAINAIRFITTRKHIDHIAYQSEGFLNIRSPLLLPRLFRWTLHCTRRASPLVLSFFLNVKNKPIHPAPSRAAALDQAIYDLIFSAERLNIRPTGNTGRVINDSLVERLWLSDGACKARFYIPWRIKKLFIAGALKASHGLFVFRLGEKPVQIFELLSHLKKRTTHFSLGLNAPLYHLGVPHSSKNTSRLNTLRVAERNFTQSIYE